MISTVTPATTLEALELQRKQMAVSLLEIEIQRKSQELRLATAVADLNSLEAEQKHRIEQANLANDIYHERYYFIKDIDAVSVKDCINQCTYWANTKPNCDIQIIFNCQGGSLFFGMMLFDFLRELDQRGHRIIVGTYGLAASMAGILLQAASQGQRYVGGESWMLIHEVSSRAQGSASEIRNEADFAKDVCARIRNIFLRNQAESIERGTASPEAKMDAAEFDAKWKNNDWWLSSDEMIRRGFADRIGSPVFNTPDAVAAG